MARVATLEERRRSAASSLARISHGQRSKPADEQSAAPAGIGAAANSSASSENEEIAIQFVEWQRERRGAVQAGEAQLQSESEAFAPGCLRLRSALKAARGRARPVRDRRGDAERLHAQAAVRPGIIWPKPACRSLPVSARNCWPKRALAARAGEELAAEDTAYREMRTKLDSMGPVNMMALEEYKETAQRHEFLDTQRKDLLDSIENTQAPSRKSTRLPGRSLTRPSRPSTTTLQRTFTKFFGGGLGLMRLTDQENSAESGIDIVASPPGKKLQNVLLLSGGEKALTALALLVGIFQYQPSPFCILDEVDAPLDDTNIGRFTEMVREMSLQTQFIIITHSKKTMCDCAGDVRRNHAGARC